MPRILRAFLWMRWRILANSLERTGARDTLDRFSIAIDKLGPLIALALLIPSALALFVLGLIAGFGVATDAWWLPFELVRWFLLAGTALTLVGPIVLPARDGGSAVRLVLLPISRLTLYTAHVTGSLADPWILLMVPLLLAVPIGVAAGLHVAGAIVALAAGIAFLLFVMGLTSLASSAIHLLLRDRRRGDLVMLFLVVLIPLFSLLPSVLVSGQSGRRHLTREERLALPPTRAQQIATEVFQYTPSELYRRATLRGREAPRSGAAPTSGVAAFALAIQALAFLAFRKVLDTPASMGARRAGSFGGMWQRVIPGLSPAASAVALTQLRLALRTPRGRAMIVTPMLVFAVFALLLYKTGGLPLPGMSQGGGVGLAAFGSFVCLISLLPFAMNQFAIDRAGFTRQMLLPLSLDELLVGKAVGNALIAAGPALVCWLAAGLLFPGLNRASWFVVPLAWIAVYLVLAPAAAALSAVFPKTVDLNSIGNASNAHQAAGLLGLLAFVAGAVPSLLLALLAARIMHRPALAPVLVTGWCVVTYAISRLLFIPVRRLVASRCESLVTTYR